MPDYEWMHTVYGDCEEEVSPDLPQPKGETVLMTSMVDANLMHCKVSKCHQALAYHRVMYP